MEDRRRDSLVSDLRQQARLAGWTPWQLARRIYETSRTPTLLMAWRLASGLTQAELAHSVRKLAADAGSPCNPSTPSCQQISRWENGHDRPGAFYQVLLARWYRTDPTRLGFIGDVSLVIDNDRLSDSGDQETNVNRRNFLAIAAVPVLHQLDHVRRRMDADLRHVVPDADVAQWTQIAEQHVAAYGTLPPATLLEQLAPEMSDFAHLVGQYLQQRDLTRLAARLCGLTGALHTDLGDRAAKGWLHTAARYAAMSGDHATQYWVAMAQAMTMTYPPNPERVLAIAAKAAADLGPRSTAAAAQLSGLAARAHALLGDSGAARAELAAAERIASGLTATQADEIFFGFPRREMLMYTSQVLTSTGDPAAWSAQTDALCAYPDSDPIDRPLILLCRSRHLARNGDPDHAAHVAATAITNLPAAWLVPLLVSEARGVGEAITAASAQVGRQFTEMLREAVQATSPGCS